MQKLSVFALLLVMAALPALSQEVYRYKVDLVDVKNDQVKIELATPKLNKSDVTFYVPKIIPGTYNIADYGRFVHNFKAYDATGKELPVKHDTPNSWKIAKASKLSRISYEVEDTWESTIQHDIYDMGGTNIEAGKNFVLNSPGFFGYFEGMTKVPFEITIKKPETLYASTPLIAAKSDKTTDVFNLADADHLYDSPIMYSAPDTTSIRLGATQVLISVYSPRKLVTSSGVADLLRTMLTATQNYLGGKLPVNRYAFIYYFNGEQEPLKRTGALEHNYSSFYALPEVPFQNIAPILLDISAHEFFHVVTPLTISSREVKEFNFNEAVLSKHLWLYEGSTEYASDHVQVMEGLASPEEFLQKLAEKIKNSKADYNDALAFTELSKESAGKHKAQYGNVYEKGALISACLDIYLLQLSKGKYGLRDLKHDLGIKYGKDKYFNDDELFDEITKLTYPEVRDFFAKYVEGPTPIPYDQFFGLAGVKYIVTKSPSIGNIQIAGSPEGNLVVAGTESMNESGKALGYKVGDEFVSLNGAAINLQNAQQVLENYKATAKDGDKLEVVVNRKNEAGEKQRVTLSAKVMSVEVYNLALDPQANGDALIVRNAWLGKPEINTTGPVAEADAKDVADIDGIIKALYGVISGPAGERNWNRFRSLFYPSAYMGAIVKTPAGEQLKKFTPEEYIKNNGPFFQKYGFYEQEVGRVMNTFGNIAQVFTTYAYKLELPEPEKQRGINSIELVRENNRWYILSIIWDEESESKPIPKDYLFPQTRARKK